MDLGELNKLQLLPRLKEDKHPLTPAIRRAASPVKPMSPGKVPDTPIIENPEEAEEAVTPPKKSKRKKKKKD